MHQRVNCLALVSVVVCLLACEGSLPTSGIRPVTSAPPAAQLLNYADASDLRDFHVTYTADLWAEGPLSSLRGPTSVRVTGSGSVVLSPTLSANLHQTSTFCADLCPEDLIVIDEDRYTTSGATPWWLDRGVTTDSYLWSRVLPSRLAAATAPRVVAEETVDGIKAWVVDANDSAGQSFRVWLSQQDGYPIQLESAPNDKTTFLDLHIKLDRFNTGVLVAAPATNQLQPVFWGTEYVREHPIPLAGGTVTIHAAGYDCNGGDTVDDSDPKAYFVLVPFTYTAGRTPLAIDPGSWTLYDRFAHAYRAQSTGAAPKLVASTVLAGHSVSGDLCFLVPVDEDNVTIVGNFPSGVVTSFVGGLRRPDTTG